MDVRQRLTIVTDRLLTGALVALLAGTRAAFGGRVWWAPAVVGGLCLAVVLLGLDAGAAVRVDGGPQEPDDGARGARVGLGVAQTVPTPGRLAAGLSPESKAVYGLGLLPEQARRLDSTVELPAAPESRSPVTLDRAATLRWIAGAAACLGVFWAVGQYADRLGRLYVVWGSVVAAFFLNTAIALVQVACGRPRALRVHRAGVRRSGRRTGTTSCRGRGPRSSARPARRGRGTPPGPWRSPTGRS